MRWVRRALITLSVFVLLIGVALTILLSIDLGRFKGTVEDYVSAATGREFVIGGRFRLEIGKTLDLWVEDVSLANAEWGVAENMLTVERLVLSIDLWSLIDGPIRVEDLEVDGLVAHVEAQADTGKSTWDFSSPVDGRSEDKEDGGFLQTGELPLLLERVRLRDIEITYGQGWLDAPRQVSVDEATLVERAGGLLELALSGALGAETLRASGRIKFGQKLIEVEDVELQVGQNIGFLDGRIPVTLQLADAEFRIRLSGPDLAYLGQTFNVSNLPSAPFRLDVTLSRKGTAYVMDELVAELAGSNLVGNVTVEFEPKRKFFGRLESDNLDLTQLLPAENPADRAAEDQPKPDRVIPDYPLPLHVLDFADVDAVIRVRRLKSESYDLGDIDLKVFIEDDRLSVEAVSVALKHGGTMAAALDLVRKSDGSADVALEIAGQQFNLRPPIDDDGNPIRRPRMDLNIKLSGSGSTLRLLAASANGLISVRQGEGELDNAFKGYVLRDVVSQVFGAINPLTRDGPHTRLHCGIIEIDVVDGVARARVAGIQTDKLVAASIGTVDLATEALDFSFRIKPREGIGISLAGAIDPFIKLGGTLAEPSLELNRKRGLLPGTVAVLTVGLSILGRGVWDRYLSADNFCEAVIAGLESGEIGAGDGQPDERKERFRLFRRENRQEKNDDAVR